MARIHLLLAMSAACIAGSAVRAGQPVKELVPVSLSEIHDRIRPGDWSLPCLRNFGQ